MIAYRGPVAVVDSHLGDDAMRFGWRFAVLVGALPGITLVADAGSSCYVQGPYPAVLSIEALRDGFRAYTFSSDYEKAHRAYFEREQRRGRKPDDPALAY